MSVTRLISALGKSQSDITTSITLTLLFRPLGALIFGLLCERYGRKWPFVANLVVCAVLSLATGFVKTFSAFLAVRCLFGIAMGGIWGQSAALGLENMPVDARGLYSGILQQVLRPGPCTRNHILTSRAPTGLRGWLPHLRRDQSHGRAPLRRLESVVLHRRCDLFVRSFGPPRFARVNLFQGAHDGCQSVWPSHVFKREKSNDVQGGWTCRQTSLDPLHLCCVFDDCEWATLSGRDWARMQTYPGAILGHELFLALLARLVPANLGEQQGSFSSLCYYRDNYRQLWCDRWWRHRRLG